MQTLHGYTVDETQWKSKGGGGQCNIAKKGGKEYFIKRLAFPRYPDSDNFKGAFKQQKIDICNDWYRRRQEIIRAIPGSGTGTTVKPIEYFREGPCYYEVANLIDVTSIPYDEIYKESKEDKARVMLTVAMSLADLHKKGIVHGDLDPRNILISRVAGSKNLVTKLIDFSDSFFENDPPETIMSKDFWWSPEVAFYSKAAASGVSPNPYKKYISCKADVFSLGIVFHQYCAKGGKPPICTKAEENEHENQGIFHLDRSRGNVQYHLEAARGHPRERCAERSCCGVLSAHDRRYHHQRKRRPGCAARSAARSARGISRPAGVSACRGQFDRAPQVQLCRPEPDRAHRGRQAPPRHLAGRVLLRVRRSAPSPLLY